jgi:hypothetical protein
MNEIDLALELYHGVKNYLGKHFQELKDSGDFEGLDNFYQYLEQPSVDITPAEANKFINSYNFIQKNDLHMYIPQRRLDLLKKSDDPKKLYDETKLLSIKDMKETMVDINNEKENKPNTRTFNYVIMQKCNETSTLKRVYGVESKEILEKFNINEDGIRHD